MTIALTANEFFGITFAIISLGLLAIIAIFKP